MRVLILAEDCNPLWPSLPVVGYKAAHAIADHAEVTVATHVRNKPAIDEAGFGRAAVQYHDTEYIAKPMYKLGMLLRGGNKTGWTTGIAMKYPSNIAFEREVYKTNKAALKDGGFDVVHRITPMSPTLPSPMARWSPVPFVLGPLNGGLKWPADFRSELAREREWLAYLRNAYRYLPYQKSTYRDSAALLAAFQHTIDDLPKSARSKAINFPEVGIDPEVFSQVQAREAKPQKTILYAGRFVPYKLPDVVVQAYAQTPALHDHKLIMVGDGPEMPRVKAVIEEHRLQDKVELPGWKTQAEVGQLMREADIFAFPSIRELGAGVVVEAMACGMACVVVDYGGPGTLIDADRGIKVPLGSKQDIASAFGDAMQKLVADPQTTVDLGQAARDHAMTYYTWDVKARKTIEVYRSILDGGYKTSPPDFWQPAAD
jgi:glycosyltransferase involved in cell wall biosynthesis